MTILNMLGLMTVSAHEAATKPLRHKLFDSEQKRIHWQGESDDLAAKFKTAIKDIAVQAKEITGLRDDVVAAEKVADARARKIAELNAEVTALKTDAEKLRNKRANDAALKREKRAAAKAQPIAAGQFSTEAGGHLIRPVREIKVNHPTLETLEGAVYLKVEARVRYWEDAEVNGAEDTDGDLIPLRKGDTWCPLIDIREGRIIDWPKETTAKIHYKVCDEGEYWLLNWDLQTVAKWGGFYVPDDLLCPNGNGYGDYIILNVDGEGQIEGWLADEFDFEPERWEAIAPNQADAS